MALFPIVGICAAQLLPVWYNISVREQSEGLCIPLRKKASFQDTDAQRSFAPGQRFSSKDSMLSPNEVVYLSIDEELIHAFGHASELFLGTLGKMRMYSPEHRNMSL